MKENIIPRSFDSRHGLQARIAQVDQEIDQGVYQLYGLEEEEIRVVEGR